MRQTPHHLRASAAAFTLIEMLTAVALIVLLMLGVSIVFRTSSETVGAGQALSAAVRDGRAFRDVIERDIYQPGEVGMVTSDTPAIIIRSERRAAFRSKNDQLTDFGWSSPLFDPTAASQEEIDEQVRSYRTDPTVNDDNYTPAVPIITTRTRRTDRLAFFYRGSELSRQTGSEGRYLDPGGSREAWIVYGHVRKPNGSGTFVDPGLWDRETDAYVPDTDNADNAFSSEWSLARNAILLMDKAKIELLENGADANGTIQIDRLVREEGAVSESLLTPIGRETQSTDGNWSIFQSRYDLAEGTVDLIRRNLRGFDAGVGQDWYDVLTGFRFQADAFPAVPITSDGVAQASSIALANCSGFIVEFAGDYLTQDIDSQNEIEDGTIVAAEPDGRLDFYLTWEDLGNPDGVLNGAERALTHTRWYGFPRDINNDGQIRPGRPRLPEDPNIADTDEAMDVVPLNAVLDEAGFSTSLTNEIPPPYRFERNTHNSIDQELRHTEDYAQADLPADVQYIAAWGGPDEDVGEDAVDDPPPQLLRFLVTIDDSQTRLPEGQTFEYVIKVPEPSSP